LKLTLFYTVGIEAVLSDEASKKEEYKKLVKDFLEELNFLTDMVNDLLFLAREDNLHTLEYTRTDLGALVHKQIGLIVLYAKAHQVRLEKKYKRKFICQRKPRTFKASGSKFNKKCH
jgi:signal transduction histidine kinase